MNIATEALHAHTRPDHDGRNQSAAPPAIPEAPAGFTESY
jgi:hypothetical protein